MSNGKVAVIMGSISDYKIMEEAVLTLDYFNVECDPQIVSAHRTPDFMIDFAKKARSESYELIIAGAGGAAHLPGMVASLTSLPVIGVPIHSSNSMDGWDSVLSILQMPAGIPVATVALDGAKNAGILAVRMLSIKYPDLTQKLEDYAEGLKEKVFESAQKLSRRKKKPGF